MQARKINNKGRARIFKNGLLEALTRTRPWVIYAIYIPLNIFMILYVLIEFQYSAVTIVPIFLIAMASWTFFEYLVHRFLFHYHATTGFAKRLVYVFHENHHEFPRDRERLFMPPVPSILLAALVFSVFGLISYMLSGTIGYAMIFFPGFITGYLIYVSMHYAIHAYAPPKYLKMLWRNHHLHHYKYPDKAFGVSSMFWDKLFDTLPDKDKSN